jgi:hypothetical protein
LTLKACVLSISIINEAEIQRKISVVLSEGESNRVRKAKSERGREWEWENETERVYECERVRERLSKRDIIA